MSIHWDVRRNDKRSGCLYGDGSNKTMRYLRFNRQVFYTVWEKREVEEPVMPLEPGKEKEKYAADVVTERKWGTIREWSGQRAAEYVCLTRRRRPPSDDCVRPMMDRM